MNFEKIKYKTFIFLTNKYRGYTKINSKINTKINSKINIKKICVLKTI